jgi:hypothetical protein
MARRFARGAADATMPVAATGITATMLVRALSTAVLLAAVGLSAHLARGVVGADAQPPSAAGAAAAPRNPTAGVVSADGAAAASPVGGPTSSTDATTSAQPRHGHGANAGAGTAPRHSGRKAGAGASAAGSDRSEKANELAREALRLVGKDPEALVIWRRAINDPALPAGNRSDLIEDLNDEGYDGQGAFTEADLQLILARLDLIEREMPLAMDATNAWAFTEAYKDLLGMLAKARADVAAAKTARR